MKILGGTWDHKSNGWITVQQYDLLIFVRKDGVRECLGIYGDEATRAIDESGSSSGQSP